MRQRERGNYYPELQRVVSGKTAVINDVKRLNAVQLFLKEKEQRVNISARVIPAH